VTSRASGPPGLEAMTARMVPKVVGAPARMTAMRVAVVQLTSGTDSTANRTRVDAALQSIEEEVDLVVLPEAAMHEFGETGYDLSAVAEPLDGPFVGLLAQHAQRLGATVVGGMFEATTGLPFNTVVAVGAEGSVVAAYRKIHLYDSFGYRESERLNAGPVEATVFEVDGLNVGLMTCYDLRFPELGRALVDAGAEVFVVPAAWVRGDDKLRHWRTLIGARAIENTVVVVAAAQSGDRYAGHSTVVDAAGRIVEEATTGDAVLMADVDAETIAGVRRINPSLQNRRMAAP